MTRHSALLGWGVSLAFAVLYLLTLCPTVFWYDSAEYATAAVTLGIPHPPGYPLYTLIAHLFTYLPTAEPAQAVNLMSAAFGAAAVGLCYRVIVAIGGSRLGAACGAATLGAGALFWSQSIIAEVYTPGLAALLLVLLLALRGLQRDRGLLLVLAAGLAGLGLGLHLFIATCGLGLVLLVMGLGLEQRIRRPADILLLVRREQMSRRLKTGLACLGALLLGSCIFLYVPLRAATKPELNMGDPSTSDRLLWFLTGGNYKHWFMTDYPFWSRLGRVAAVFYDQLLVVGIPLVCAGLVHLLRKRPLIGLGLLLMVVGNVVFFFRYAVHDVEVFFLPSVVVMAVLVGPGIDAVVRWVDARSARAGIQRMARVGLALLPISLVFGNYRAVDLNGYTAARDFGERLCRQLPERAMLVNFTTPPEWKNNAVFGDYFQMVLRRRRDVKVLTLYWPAEVLQALRTGRPVFAYYPVDRLRPFVLRKEGDVYRVLGVRPPPGWRPSPRPGNP